MRLRAAYETTNRNPLGACAITGTGFPIDRALTSDLLGFAGPTGNTYGSIATVDYLLESASATAVLLAGSAGSCRICCCGARRNWATCGSADGFVQASSIMPQKRNPVALEHARAIGSKALGQAQAIGWRSTTRRSATSSTPKTICSRWSWSMFRDATRAVSLVAAAMATAEFDAERLEARRRQAG